MGGFGQCAAPNRSGRWHQNRGLKSGRRPPREKTECKAEEHYLQLLKHHLRTAGTQVKEEQMTQLLNEVVKYNPWFQKALSILKIGTEREKILKQPTGEGITYSDGICNLGASAIGPIPSTD